MPRFLTTSNDERHKTSVAVAVLSFAVSLGAASCGGDEVFVPEGGELTEVAEEVFAGDNALDPSDADLKQEVRSPFATRTCTGYLYSISGKCHGTIYSGNFNPVGGPFKYKTYFYAQTKYANGYKWTYSFVSYSNLLSNFSLIGPACGSPRCY